MNPSFVMKSCLTNMIKYYNFILFSCGCHQQKYQNIGLESTTEANSQEYYPAAFLGRYLDMCGLTEVLGASHYMVDLGILCEQSES